MKKGQKMIVLAVVIAFVFGIGIFAFSSNTFLTYQQEPIIITMDVWAGFAHSFVAQEKGFFADEGLNIKLELRPKIEENFQAFADGKVDALYGTQANVMKLYAEGVLAKIVTIVDFSNGGNVIVSKLNIKTIQDLKGKKVSVETMNDFTHIFLVEILKQNGLKESDVIIVPLPGSEVPEALESGIIDAGQTWEPFQSYAIANGNRLLTSSEETPGIITDVLIFQPKFVEERPDDVKKILIALFRAQAFHENNENESLTIMSESLGMSPGSLKETLNGIAFPNLEESKNTFLQSESPTSLYNSGKIISEFFVEKGLITKPINLEELFANEIISSIDPSELRAK